MNCKRGSGRSSRSFRSNAPARTEIYTLSLHDALPIFGRPRRRVSFKSKRSRQRVPHALPLRIFKPRSEEHTSELQSLAYLVCRLLLEKKNVITLTRTHTTKDLTTDCNICHFDS